MDMYEYGTEQYEPYSFCNDAVIGNHEWKGKIDLINIIMIGIAKELPEQDERYELHRLLGALLSQKLTVDEKMSIMETEYDIELEEKFAKGCEYNV